MTAKEPDVRFAKRVSRLRLGVAAWLLGCLALTSAGCKSVPATTKPDTGAMVAPSYQQLAEPHNQRIAKLQKLYAMGVIEIRWRDDHGNHFDQGNMELWVQLPRHTALRVEKLGEVPLWLGSDDQRYWLFDNKEKVLRVGMHDEANAPGPSGPIDVKPLALLDLMALSPLPVAQGGQATPAVHNDDQRNAWVIEAAGSGGPMRVYFDRKTEQISRVETLSSDGKILLFSNLTEYKPATLSGVAPLAYPKIAHKVEIASAPQVESASNIRGCGNVSVFIDEATGVFDANSNVFDLNRLMQSMPPDRIEGQLRQEMAAPASLP